MHRRLDSVVTKIQRKREAPAPREPACALSTTKGSGSEEMSASSDPAAAAMKAIESPMVRASGPKWDMLSKTLGRMVMGTRPRLGLKPTAPESAAGIRTDPPMSVPSANGTTPVATATADPPDEPPEVRSGFQGLRVTPHRGLDVKLEWANSGVVVLPMRIAPASSSRSMHSAVFVGTQSRASRSRAW